MPTVQALWILSLAAEFGVVVSAVRRAWYRAYPKFFAYLIFDLSASLLLFWISWRFPASHYPFVYDLTWRGTQLLLVGGRLLLVVESYQRLASSVKWWRFSDGIVWPTAALAAMAVHWIGEQPFRWPDSKLETVFGMIGAAHALMGFSLIGILAAAHRHDLRGTVPYRHGQILCGYLLSTSVCFYNAGRLPANAGWPLTIVATVCYATWLYFLSRPPSENGVLGQEDRDSANQPVSGLRVVPDISLLCGKIDTIQTSQK